MRTTRDARRAGEWVLVLQAHGIPHEILTSPDGEIAFWTLPADSERASQELDEFDRENVPVPPAPDVPRWGRSSIGLAVAWLLIASFGMTSGTPALTTRGSASAERLVAGGEWWRAITALTLHADLTHVLGNAAAAGVLLTAAAWRIGPGMTAAITLASGIAGNVITAVFYRSRHDSIGSSTAVFGTLGLVTAIALFDAWKFGVRRRAPWVLFGASLALLGFLGSGERSDVLAHAAGWACGIGFGLAALAARPSPLRGLAQAALLLAASAVIAGGWSMAGIGP